MNKLIATILITVGFAASSAFAADVASIADSFKRDAERNFPIVQAQVSAGPDFIQQYVNRELSGGDAVYTSFNNDLNRVAGIAAATTERTRDAFQQYVNRELNGNDAVYISFNSDLYRKAVSVQRIVENTDGVQQQVNIALRYQSNPLVASFEHKLGVTIQTASAARPALRLGANGNGFWLGETPLTLFA